ncbi:Transmembrane protein 17B [Collichthys lucidus]|uniref:Transmembrane protein 17B n=1 Tax=Collichthys lucidus TaxID=240159 RepID=A0A4V6ARE4_COLLU|nr:Transmembrane protein 17B [Collichthys lucidus]
MEMPETLRRRLEDFSRTVLFDRSRTQSFTKEDGAFLAHDKRVLSSLPLQMSLYFNMWFFPLWWISEIVMLQLKYPALPDYYKFILVTILIMMTLIEAIRLFLGYAGNLQEKVPELAGFWLLSILLQFPLILFQLFNEAILIQPWREAFTSFSPYSYSHSVVSIFLMSLKSSRRLGIAFSLPQSHLTDLHRLSCGWRDHRFS